MIDTKPYQKAIVRVLEDLPTRNRIGLRKKGIPILGVARPVIGPQVITLTFRVHDRDVDTLTRDKTAERFATAASAPFVRSWRDHGLVRVEFTLPRSQWTPVPFRGLPQRMGEGITIGMKALGGPARLAFEGPNPHKAIFGSTQSGKSVFLADVIMALVRQDPQVRKYRIAIMNPKPEPMLKLFDRLPHLAQPVANDAQSSVDILRWAVAEMVRRGEDPSRQATELFLICDEFASIARSHQDGSQALLQLSEKGGGLGIHIIVASQSSNPSVLGSPGTAILANMPARVVFQLPNQQSYGATGLAGQHTERLGGDGDALAVADGWTTRLRTALPDRKDFDSLPRVDSPPQPAPVEDRAEDVVLEGNYRVSHEFETGTRYETTVSSVDLGRQLAYALVTRRGADSIQKQFGIAMTTARMIRDLATYIRRDAVKMRGQI